MSNVAAAAAALSIANIPLDGVRNGTFVTNTAMPASSYIRPRSLWVLRAVAGAQPTIAALLDSVCWASRADLSAAARAALPADEKISIEGAAIIALGRAAAWRYFGLNAGSISAGETITLAEEADPLVVHADHEAEVAAAIAKYASFAERLTGIAWYVAISFEQFNHHHLPDVSKRLASTTITLLGMEEAFTRAVADQLEGIVMHDMFHPLGGSVKSTLARNKSWARALSRLGFDNLRKRCPVKATDCALALNYPVLIEKARSYPHSMDQLPVTLNAPVALLSVIAAYENATTEAQVDDTVSDLRVMAARMDKMSAYVAGFMLGREARSMDDEELTLKRASATVTILGSPAYKRAAADHPGLFAMGKEAGFTAPGAADKRAAVARVKEQVARGMGEVIAALNANRMARNAAV